MHLVYRVGRYKVYTVFWEWVINQEGSLYYCPWSIAATLNRKSIFNWTQAFRGHCWSSPSISPYLCQWEDCEVRLWIPVDSWEQNFHWSFLGNKAVEPWALTLHSHMHFVKVKVLAWQRGVTWGPSFVKQFWQISSWAKGEGGLGWGVRCVWGGCLAEKTLIQQSAKLWEH